MAMASNHFKNDDVEPRNPFCDTDETKNPFCDSDDEESFVVLEKDSLKSEQDLSSINIEAIEESLNLISQQTAQTKMLMTSQTGNSTPNHQSIDDIQARVVELLEENKTLKGIRINQ